jgi:hypothetical protein
MISPLPGSEYDTSLVQRKRKNPFQGNIEDFSAIRISIASPEVIERMGSEYLYLTSLFVIMGVMRYLQIAFVHLDSGSPTGIMLKDRFIQFTLLLWIVSFVWILY